MSTSSEAYKYESNQLDSPALNAAAITPEQIAEVAHEVNRAYCSSIGDKSPLSWADAPEWQKSSAINGVMFHMQNSETTPEDSHVNWLKQKEQEGWIYGPVKDPEKKEHPCMVSYDELPIEQRSKDYLFRQVVHSLSALDRLPGK